MVIWAKRKTIRLRKVSNANATSEKLWKIAMIMSQADILNMNIGRRTRKASTPLVSSWIGLTIQNDPMRMGITENIEETIFTQLKSSFMP